MSKGGTSVTVCSHWSMKALQPDRLDSCVDGAGRKNRESELNKCHRTALGQVKITGLGIETGHRRSRERQTVQALYFHLGSKANGG